jgi:hypothetical protein
VPQTQRRIGSNAALAVKDACDPVHRHVDLALKLRRSDAKLTQFFGKLFAGMDGGTGHIGLPSITTYVNSKSLAANRYFAARSLRSFAQ